MWYSRARGFSLAAIKNPHGFVLYIVADVRRQTCAGRITNFDLGPEGILKDLVARHKGDQAEILVGCRIDEDINIGIRFAFIAGERTEQIKGSDAESSQSRLSLPQSKNDIL